MIGAGLAVTINPSALDETAYKESHSVKSAPELAAGLAAEKARLVSERAPKALVIGADQTMECEGLLYDKPSDMVAARHQLTLLRNRSHALHSAVSVARGGNIIWETIDDARLTMRDFDDEFLTEYLRLAGESVLTSVGGYRLEGLGAHLFEKIDGDYFTILGLPLLPLLAFLRTAKILH